jgi:hypothetical protein
MEREGRKSKNNHQAGNYTDDDEKIFKISFYLPGIDNQSFSVM